MTVAVRYFTRSGNTEKLAVAIGEAVGVKAASVSVPLAEKVDLLFLGCSYYAFDVDEAIKEFLVKNKDCIGRIVCVGTSAMMRSMKKPIKKITDSIGVGVCDEEFHCRGEFAAFHKGRPHAADLANAADFAKNLVGKCTV